eukprot:1161380-Pelagomonas_calceolata.AAC.13
MPFAHECTVQKVLDSSMNWREGKLSTPPIDTPISTPQGMSRHVLRSTIGGTNELAIAPRH